MYFKITVLKSFDREFHNHSDTFGKKKNLNTLWNITPKKKKYLPTIRVRFNFLPYNFTYI